MTILKNLALPMIGLSLATLSSFAACSTQVDDNYQGEALATMRGSITNERSVTPPQAYAGLLWFGEDNSRGEGEEGFIAVGESIPVSGNFPAQFELDLLAPPPADALMQIEPPYGPQGLEFGIAFIGVFDMPPEQIDFTNEAELVHILGLAENHFVIYSNMDINDMVGEVTHGPFQAGYTIMRVERKTEADDIAYGECYDEVNNTGVGDVEACGTSFDELFPVENHLDTLIPVRMVDDFEQLDLPSIG